VLRVLSAHIAGGELDDVRQSLPKDVREVWPQAA
jgi:uncharacterized protein (DUF2267 family)